MRLPFFAKNSIYNSKTRRLRRFIAPDDVVIDVGANIGDFARQFLPIKCEIKCFEPNPACFPQLQKLSEMSNNVEVIRAAASVSEGKANLFFHEKHEEDPVAWSTGSSLFQGKVNVDPSSYVEVDTIDLSKYIFALKKPVRILKVDIEGHEVELLPHLLRTGCLSNVSCVLVETHEMKNHSLVEATAAMKKMFEEYGFSRISWDWI